MDSQTFDTPILFIIFNRPETTATVFESIRKLKPTHLYIAADGPRATVPEDAEKCRQARKIVENIDWPCQVENLFQENNLGCGYAVSGAINWFFDNVENGIILEDDCLPDQSFFYFCRELLSFHKDNERIMHISGNNFQHGKKRGLSSYYFSKYTHNWGWATWRRAWKYNDFEMIGTEGRKHIWDKQWLLSVKKNNGLAIMPNLNLVSNIGFGRDATHTQLLSREMNLPAQKMTFPLIHPKIIRPNESADFLTYREIFGGSRKKLLFEKVLPIIPKSLKNRVKNSLGKWKRRKSSNFSI